MPITTEPDPNPLPAGGAKCRITGTYGDSAWGVGFWLNTTGSPASGDLDDLAHSMFTAFEDTILTEMCHVAHVTHSKVVYADSPGVLFEGNWTGDETGGDSGDPGSAQIAAVISWPIVVHYRGGKPRTYVPAISIARFQTETTYASSFLTDLASDAATFRTTVNGLDAGGITAVELGVWRFFSAGLALDPPAFYAFGAPSVQTRVCTQRRRLGPTLS